MRYSVRTPDGLPLYRSGDIVPIDFPEIHRPDVSGPKSRPCLVIDQQDGRISLAYGTDETKKFNADPDDIVLLDYEWKQYGLRKATRFCINRVVNFPVNGKWFDLTRDKPFGTLAANLFKPFYTKLTRRILHHCQQVPHVARGGILPPAPGAALELNPHCASVKSDDFTMEFYFDGEYPGDNLVEAINLTPLLSPAEKTTSVDALRARRVPQVVQGPKRRATRPGVWI